MRGVALVPGTDATREHLTKGSLARMKTDKTWLGRALENKSEIDMNRNRPSQPNDSASYRDCQRFGAIFRSELLQDAFHVHLHGLFRNAQDLPDIAVSFPITKTRQNLNLAPSQFIVARVLGELSR